MKLLLSCFVTLLLILIAPQCLSDNQNHSSEQQIIPLSGTWQFKADDHQNWTDIHVPANWYREGHDISGIAWYKKTFHLPENLKNKRVRLNFKGVDYTAEVWLNDHRLGFHEGYFQAFGFDATNAALFGKDNVLLVKVDSPLEKTGEDWSLHKRLIKGIFSHHDTRPGGAWSNRGQERNTGGIWADVDLEIHNTARIEAVHVTPQLNLAQNQATANVAFQIDLQQQTQLSTQIRLSLKPYNFPSLEGTETQIEHTLSAGINELSIPLTLKNPHLWWTWEQGEPNLYTLEIAIFSKNKLIESQRVTFGFRSVSYDNQQQVWLLNGKRQFLRGTNYIASQWLSEMTPARFGFDIALMKNANVNIVRVHAHVTAADFYRQCDEAGVLIWQDFPLQWGYADDEAFRNNAVQQAKDMVSQLYNHPSIITWSLINEPVWDADWMQYKYRTYRKDYNKPLTDTLYQAIAPLDKTRHVHPFSSTAEHPWLGWYSGSWLDYNKPTKIAVVTEYGAQALPDLPSLRNIFNEDELWPQTDKAWEKWEYHNFQRKETFENAQVLMGNFITEFIDNTQTYQAKLIKLAAESYRRQRYQPVNSIFQFMFVEDWESVNWGIIDYWRNPKLGYYALKQAYQAVLPSIAWKKESFNAGETAEFNLWVVNDLLKPFPEAQLRYSLRDSKTVLETQVLTINIAPDSGGVIQGLAWSNLPAGHYEIVAKIIARDGKVLGINSHKFEIKP